MHIPYTFSRTTRRSTRQNIPHLSEPTTLMTTPTYHILSNIVYMHATKTMQCKYNARATIYRIRSAVCSSLGRCWVVVGPLSGRWLERGWSVAGAWLDAGHAGHPSVFQSSLWARRRNTAFLIPHALSPVIIFEFHHLMHASLRPASRLDRTGPLGTSRDDAGATPRPHRGRGQLSSQVSLNIGYLGHRARIRSVHTCINTVC